MESGSRRTDPMTEISASRSCGGIRPAASGSVVAMRCVLAVLRDDYVDVGAHVTMQLQRHLVLTKCLDRLPEVDLVPVDLDAVLRLQRRGDVLVGDRAERLVLVADLQAHDHGLVVYLVLDRLRSGAILRLALLRGFAQPPGFGLGPLPRPDGHAAA